MKTITLPEVKAFPAYVEFMSKYYLLPSPLVGDEAYLLEVSTTKSKSALVVTANRVYNVLTEAEYKEKLEDRMLVLEAEAERVSKATTSMNFHATDTEEIAEANATAKNLLAGQLASMRAKKKE